MENPLWNYSLAHYSKPGVEALCIALQDDCGADINLLLYAAWLARRGEILDESRLRSLLESSAVLRLQVVAPLRALRRQWKGLPEVASLRERLKQLELAAERELQDGLWRWHTQQPAAERGGTLVANLERVLVVAGVTGAEAVPRAQALAEVLQAPAD